MEIECSLEAIKNFLEMGNLSPTFVQKQEENQLDFLLLPVGEDEQGRLFEIGFYVAEKQLDLTENSPSSQKPEKFLLLRYFFPFKFEEASVSDMARYILLVNRSSEFEGFGMSEAEGMIYFHHELYCANNKIDSRIIKTILGYLLLMVDTHGPKIEKIARSELTFLEAIQAG